jgi:hypothetical protein
LVMMARTVAVNPSTTAVAPSPAMPVNRMIAG